MDHSMKLGGTSSGYHHQTSYSNVNNNVVDHNLVQESNNMAHQQNLNHANYSQSTTGIK